MYVSSHSQSMIQIIPYTGMLFPPSHTELTLYRGELGWLPGTLG